MFIYLKKNVHIKDCKYIINRKETENGQYFEILFSSSPSRRTVEKAVRRCSRQPLPIAQTGFRLSERLERRCLPSKGFTEILLVNAFCVTVSGQKRALVCDRDGRFCNMLLTALTRVGTLCVLTERPDIYDRFSRVSLSTVGSSPLIISQKEAYGFPATLCAERSNLAEGIIFGEGGFMPCGDTVIYRGEEYDRTLMAALYSCFDSRKAALCLPRHLQNGQIRVTHTQLKQMLDSVSGLNL